MNDIMLDLGIFTNMLLRRDMSESDIILGDHVRSLQQSVLDHYFKNSTFNDQTKEFIYLPKRGFNNKTYILTTSMPSEAYKTIYDRYFIEEKDRTNYLKIYTKIMNNLFRQLMVDIE